MSERSGTPTLARHWVSVGGMVTSEVMEVLDSAGGVAQRRAVANVYGRGTPIGRYLVDSAQYQFFIKNHLGNTVRVVNADGSYATTPVFDYQPYGELQGIREDEQNPVTAKFTGKELDPTVNLYYFGARWYDQELGVWLTVDPAQQFPNPYSYGGDPINFFDPYGLEVWSIFRPSKWERFGRHSQTYMRDHAIDDLQTVAGTILINTAGIGVCIATEGGFCAVGYYDGRKDEANIYGGGWYGSGGYVFRAQINSNGVDARAWMAGANPSLYYGEAYLNTRTGDFNIFAATLGAVPLGLIMVDYESNYKTQEYQLLGTWNLLIQGAIWRTRRLGWGAVGYVGVPCSDMHYSRNRIGRNHEGIPMTRAEADADPNWEKRGDIASDLHGGRGNVVYLEGSVVGGGRQVVYNKDTGELVRRRQVEGTYNYIQNNDGTIKGNLAHAFVDLLPAINPVCGD